MNKFWLCNVLLENGFEYEEGRVKSTKTKLNDLLIDNGKIIKIQESGSLTDELPKVDAKGLLGMPSFIDNHIHLDKGHYGGDWSASTPFISVSDRIKEEEGFLKDFLPHTKERAKKLIDLVTGYGVTNACVQVNVDPVIGLANLERVKEALEESKNKMNYSLVAFPQHGLLKGDTASIMKEALRKGVNVVGGLDPATIDNNIEASLNKTMEIAVEFDKDIDIHIHDRGSLGIYTIKRLLNIVEDASWMGRVTVSHGYSLGDIGLSEAEEIAEHLKALNVSISTTSPIDTACPPIPFLNEKGVKVNIINDNINDHWSPFGTGDLLQRASRMAERFGLIDEYSLNRSLGFITNGKMPLDAKGNVNWPKSGDEASIVFVKASCSAEAIARIPERKAVMFKGNIVYGSL